MNKKQGDQMQFFPERRIEKRKQIHSLLSTYHSRIAMECVLKWGNRFINSIRNFLMSQNFYHATDKKHWS